MPPGLDNLRHVVVLMMENCSFDHMLGSLTAVDPRIDGITAELSNPDTTGALVNPQPLAQFQGQSDPDPRRAPACMPDQFTASANDTGSQPSPSIA
ncbi:MAG: alkaline phosphatase family protein [Terriglobales bacterium]